jgi:2-octaprenyl-6-methoxyphenol hydroxylase
MGKAEEICDVIIAGSGLSGMTCALALRPPAVKGDPRLVLVGGEADSGRPDLRALAITRSSQHMFEVMGIWKEIAARAEPLQEILVSDSRPGDNQALTLLHWDSSGDPGQASAHFVEADDLYRILKARMANSKVRWVKADVRLIDHGPGLATVETSEGERLRARLLIAADGKDSLCRRAAGIEIIRHDYAQIGLVASLDHQRPHGGRAREFFLPGGPFALLPLRGRRSSIVWTEQEGVARAILAEGQERFMDELRKRAGDHLGAMTLAKGPQAFPLSLSIAKTFGARRTALIGDAAHVIHPLAGLGFNLAMRDIAALAQVVMEDMRLGLDFGSEGTLEVYARRRRLDTLMNAMMPDLLNRLFSNDREALRMVRGLGLGLVDRLPILKDMLMQEAAGLTGDLPKLMQGEAI